MRPYRTDHPNGACRSSSLMSLQELLKHGHLAFVFSMDHSIFTEDNTILLDSILNVSKIKKLK